MQKLWTTRRPSSIALLANLVIFIVAMELDLRNPVGRPFGRVEVASELRGRKEIVGGVPAPCKQWSMILARGTGMYSYQF